jgi:hypothetical protein
MLVNFFLI